MHPTFCLKCLLNGQLLLLLFILNCNTDRIDPNHVRIGYKSLQEVIFDMHENVLSIDKPSDYNDDLIPLIYGCNGGGNIAYNKFSTDPDNIMWSVSINDCVQGNLTINGNVRLIMTETTFPLLDLPFQAENGLEIIDNTLTLVDSVSFSGLIDLTCDAISVQTERIFNNFSLEKTVSHSGSICNQDLTKIWFDTEN